MPEDSRPALDLVACGARTRLASCPRSSATPRRKDGTFCVIATPNGLKFLDEGNIAGLSGHPVRTRYKRPDEPDLLPSPDALVVAPATFNTVNKWAQGISDTLALGLLNEAVGLGLPMIAAPWPNAALAAHPVFIRSVGLLREWGVTVLLDPGGRPRPRCTAWPAPRIPRPRRPACSSPAPPSPGTNCALCCPACVRRQPRPRVPRPRIPRPRITEPRAA